MPLSIEPRCQIHRNDSLSLELNSDNLQDNIANEALN